MNVSPRFDPDCTDYPAVRRVMGPQRMRLDDTQLEDLIESMFPESDAGDVENFMRGLQSLGRQVAPLAQRALPGVLKGAASGAAVAGPWGAIAGGLGGGAASLFGGGSAAPRPASVSAPRPGVAPPSRAATVAPTATAAPTATTTATTAPMASTATTATATAGPPAAVIAAPPPDAGVAAARPQAAAQLLALLSRPETTQALLALLMADAGRPAVAVGPNAVPAQAFAGAIAELASEAAAAWSGPARHDYSDYLLDDAGDPRGDIYNPAARAALLLADLAEVADGESDDDDRQPQRVNAGESLFEADTGGGDPIDSYEAALNGRSSDDD